LYGTAISVVGATAYLIFMFHRETRFPVRRLIPIYGKPLLGGICVALLASRLVPVRELHWPGVISTAVAVVVVQGSGLVLLRYFDAFDLRVLERLLPVPEILRRSSLFR